MGCCLSLIGCVFIRVQRQFILRSSVLLPGNPIWPSNTNTTNSLYRKEKSRWQARQLHSAIAMTTADNALVMFSCKFFYKMYCKNESSASLGITPDWALSIASGIFYFSAMNFKNSTSPLFERVWISANTFTQSAQSLNKLPALPTTHIHKMSLPFYKSIKRSGRISSALVTPAPYYL